MTGFNTLKFDELAPLTAIPNLRSRAVTKQLGMRYLKSFEPAH